MAASVNSKLFKQKWLLFLLESMYSLISNFSPFYSILFCSMYCFLYNYVFEIWRMSLIIFVYLTEIFDIKSTNVSYLLWKRREIRINDPTQYFEYWFGTLRKIPKFHLISCCGSFVERHSGNCAFSQYFRTMKSDEIKVFTQCQILNVYSFNA